MSANSEMVYYLVTTNWLRIRYPGMIPKSGDRFSDRIMPKDEDSASFDREIASRTHGGNARHP